MFIKYPRTDHLEGSKQLDLHFSLFSKDKEQIPFHSLKENIFIEEKMDGIGLGVGFTDGQYYIQHRGHIYYSTDDNVPYFIKDFSLWILEHEEILYTCLENKYCLFGEWLQYKHTIFYNSLPSLFLEYDIYSKEENIFLSTPERQKLLKPFPQLHSVHVIDCLNSLDLKSLISLGKEIQYSIGKNEYWMQDLEKLCHQKNLDFQVVLQNTLKDNLFEGFYIKTENERAVTGRYKWIRKSFIDNILNSDHWKKRPIIENIAVSIPKLIIDSTNSAFIKFKK